MSRARDENCDVVLLNGSVELCCLTQVLELRDDYFWSVACRSLDRRSLLRNSLAVTPGGAGADGGDPAGSWMTLTVSSRRSDMAVYDLASSTVELVETDVRSVTFFNSSLSKYIAGGVSGHRSGGSLRIQGLSTSKSVFLTQPASSLA